MSTNVSTYADLSIKSKDPLSQLYRYPLCQRFLIRPLSKTSMTPNQVSFSHVVVGLIAAIFLAQGTWPMLIVAALLYEIQRILDCLDGELARTTDQVSDHGELIEVIADGTVYVGLVIASYVYLIRSVPLIPTLILVLGAGLVILCMGLLSDHYLAKLKKDSLNKPDDHQQNRLIWILRLLWAENVALILSLGMLTNTLLFAFPAAILYGVIMIGVAVLSFNRLSSGGQLSK